ncbi:Peptide deformylase [subsurface metagenome]
MMRELRTVPDKILRTPCKPVKDIDDEVKSVAEDLIDYMLAHREDEIAPVSMAAPQLGEPIRVIAFYLNPSYRERDGTAVLINPELTKVSKFAIFRESCLSVPGKEFYARRAKRVKVKGLSLDGKSKSYKAGDLLAQVLQHEIDHLDGILVDEAGRKP